MDNRLNVLHSWIRAGRDGEWGFAVSQGSVNGFELSAAARELSADTDVATFQWTTTTAPFVIAGVRRCRGLTSSFAACPGERDIHHQRLCPGRMTPSRHRVNPLIPRPARPWSEQVPKIAYPERPAFLDGIAGMMDQRKERVGEHAPRRVLGA
jgi:hypothetical protein